MRIRTAILAAAAGAAVAYLSDPISGASRRQRLRSRITAPIPGRSSPPDEALPLPENLAPTAPSSPDVIVSPASAGQTTPALRPDRPPSEVRVPSVEDVEAKVAPSPARREDTSIAGDVRAKLQRRPDLGADELVIDVVNGVAYLSGDLRDQHTFGEVVDLTREVPGVRRVQSLLHLPPSETIPGTTVGPSDDPDTA